MAEEFVQKFKPEPKYCDCGSGDGSDFEGDDCDCNEGFILQIISPCDVIN
jgi:hypothetical protein